MLIAGGVKKETDCIQTCTRDYAGLLGEEYWQITVCNEMRMLLEFIKTKPQLDMMCLDITKENILQAAERLRTLNKKAYIILVADKTISPLTYMKPSIMAGSLMLKPLTVEQIRRVMKEAVGEVMKRFENPDKQLVFALENQDGRMLVEYDRIVFFESREKKIYLNMRTKEIGFYGTLDQLEKELAPQFLRCHRSFLVNRVQIERLLSGQNLLVLKDGTEIPISRSYRQAVKEQWK